MAKINSAESPLSNTSATSKTSKAKWWNIVLLAESVVLHPKVKSLETIDDVTFRHYLVSTQNFPLTATKSLLRRFSFTTSFVNFISAAAPVSREEKWQIIKQMLNLQNTPTGEHKSLENFLLVTFAKFEFFIHESQYHLLDLWLFFNGIIWSIFSNFHSRRYVRTPVHIPHCNGSIFPPPPTWGTV